MKFTVTFHKSDFAGANLEQLIAILKQNAVKGEGYWYEMHKHFISANMTEEEYDWIMENVANYGDTNINK